MMPLDPKEEIAGLRKSMSRIALLEAPGTILLALALYGKFGANGNAFHPALNDPAVTTGMAIIGGVIVAWGTLKAIAIARRIASIQRDAGV